MCSRDQQNLNHSNIANSSNNPNDLNHPITLNDPKYPNSPNNHPHNTHHSPNSLHSPRAKFVCVYIEEAHADDEWPIRTLPALRIRQHRDIQERAQAARNLASQLHWPVLLDSMSNGFNAKYASWPLRAYIIDNDSLRVVFILHPRASEDEERGKGGYYALEDLEAALQGLGCVPSVG